MNARFPSERDIHADVRRNDRFRPVADIKESRFTARMQALESLFRRFARRRRASWWVGKRPDVRQGQVAKVIAGKVGLPSARDDPFAEGRMVALDWAAAAHVLAVAGTISLAYTKLSPSDGVVRDTKKALADLASDATFLSNGHWKEGDAISWNPLTSATFDCGLIGFDQNNAFIFWVEEED